MVNKVTIQQDIQFTGALKGLVQAYQEISVLRMQKIRGSVLQTRIFIEKLSEVFFDVRSSYKREIQALNEQKKSSAGVDSFVTQNKNGKTVSVLLSANAKLYGDIIRQVFHTFLADVQKQDSDIVVIGRVGKMLYDDYGLQKKYQFFDLPDNLVSVNELKNIVSYVSGYETVNVYHGKFENIFRQQAMISNVSGDAPLGAVPEETEQKTEYFFEPSLDNVLNYFDTQVLTALIKQTVHEGELSKLASRVRAMEDAFNNIDKEQNKLKKQHNLYKKMTQNKKQLESLSGISLWGGGR